MHFLGEGGGGGNCQLALPPFLKRACFSKRNAFAPLVGLGEFSPFSSDRPFFLMELDLTESKPKDIKVV